MSVRGEFQRILGDTTARLRVAGEHDLAAALEAADGEAGSDLEVRAGAVLDRLESLPAPERPEALEHLRAICRVVTGR